MQAPSVKGLYQPNPIRWLSLIAVDWAMIVLAFAAAGAADNLAVYWLASLLIGNRLHAVAVMGHDGSHFAAARNRRLNDCLTATLAFWPLGLSLKGYRKFHFAHHANTGTPKDPELHSKTELSPQFDFPMNRRRLALQLLKDLTAIDPRALISFMMVMRSRKIYHYVGTAAWNLMFWGVCLWTGNYWILVLYYFSLMSSFVACFRARIWIEHMGVEGTHRVVLSPLAAFLFAPHWIWVHYEHHRWPWIPCWNLLKARATDTSVPVVTLPELMARLEAHARAPAYPVLSADASWTR